MVLLCPQPKPSMQMLAIALTVMVACTSDPGWLHMTRIKTSGACLAFTREACLCEHTRHRPSPPDPPRPTARPLDRECDTSPGSVLANRAAAEACRAPRVARFSQQSSGRSLPRAARRCRRFAAPGGAFSAGGNTSPPSRPAVAPHLVADVPRMPTAVRGEAPSPGGAGSARRERGEATVLLPGVASLSPITY